MTIGSCPNFSSPLLQVPLPKNIITWVVFVTDLRNFHKHNHEILWDVVKILAPIRALATGSFYTGFPKVGAGKRR